MTAHPWYGELRQVTPFASVLLERNPSSMTLEGTNTWVLRAPDSAHCVIVDPGYHDLEHLELVADCGPAELVLLTHHHGDHSEGAGWLADQMGAPVRAFDSALCQDATAVQHEDVVRAAGLDLRVLHTPGHTADSICLDVSHAGERAVLTGDTVLGRGTTVIAHPDGQLGAYLDSMRVLVDLPAGVRGLPGHGPEMADLAETARYYLRHREERLDQVRDALRQLGASATPRQVVELVYADVDQALWGPAEWSVRAQLDYLRAEA
ncbi:glyoxylase-like metal-dependent hydrolase (beta-lactamase superfamily II) [Tamaricihabitans halophyticus]|uniref:Glyoxylase-like metal-dependent hydrolase (Beta-lactamase superfamily II) n=1 Tax=Tamaricihabitans halophyticus TaxID=1262583 RepID=A0A4R2RBS7_9PSEU|nr:MBL fold metallo-hydrolase [Tamaricihabitans halophyticus]TCP56875.1 glyoxylase-like metal-dependent hydrolase (beta-lactamase superfamily II) [Tamaricihabitans halophyticus]